jgi:hypothetical protein
MRFFRGRGALQRSWQVIANLALAFVLCAVPRCPDAFAQNDHDYCGTSIPPDEAIGFVPLPEGDVFCPLVADPKSGYSFVSYVRGTSSSAFGTDLGSVGIADQFGLVRWGGPHPGDGLQISLEGAVFAQFDLDTPSYDLINADYVVGLPITMRRGNVSARVRIYHQSSHLGDEYLLRPGVERENFAFQSAEAILSVDGGPLRLYGGGEYVFNRFPGDRESGVIHAGIELRQHGPGLRLGSVASVRVVAAGDFKWVEELDWIVASSVRAGFEIGRPTGSTHVGRRWSVLGHFYDGASPYGQFFRANVRYYGVGLHFSL